MASKNKILLALLVLLLPLVSICQDTLNYRIGQRYHFHLNNGETVKGVVVAENAVFVTVEKRPEFDRVDLRKNTIVQSEVVAAENSRQEDPLGENPHADNYMLSSPALLFEPNQLNTTAHWLILQQLEYAFTENVAVSAGSIAFYPTSVGLKLAYKVGELNYLGAGFGTFFDLGAGDNHSALLAYVAQAKYTHGTSNRNFSLGAGFLGLNSQLMNIPTTEFITSTPLLSGAFCNRFAPRWSMVLDGYFLPEELAMIGGLGFKFLKDDESCWTFGAFSFLNNLGPGNAFSLRSFSYPLPYFSYTKKFF